MSKITKSERTVEVPEGVSVSLEGSVVNVTGPKGGLSREMKYPGVEIRAVDGGVVVSGNQKKKSANAIIGTFAAHIKNMITGVTKGFEYRLKVVYAHFPITVKHSGDTVVINNFLGEKTPRKGTVQGNCTVDIKGDTVSVTGINIEEVSQTAANIERATKVKNRDRRVFQDGIYLIEKGEANG